MLDLSTLRQPDAAAKPAAFISDTNTAGFEKDVLELSMKKPVIVDFWAPWCGPCKQMMPALEKTVTAANGAVHLVKVNVDENPELSQMLRIQSVPTVYAFFQGQPVDGFMGAKPESELKAFIAKLTKLAAAAPAPEEDEGAVPGALPPEAVAKMMLQADEFFRDGKFIEAMGLYGTVLDSAPENMEALAGIGWCLHATQDMAGLAELMSQLTPEQKSYSRLKGLQKFLQIAAETIDLEDAATLQARIEKNPKDLQAYYDLAQQYIGQGNLEAAIDALVDLTRKDRNWQEQKARGLLLDMFEAMGPQHPLTSQGRRRLSAILFS